MDISHIQYSPLPGRTYSLFGNSDSSDGYYIFIEEYLDKLLKNFESPELLLELLQRNANRLRTHRLRLRRKQVIDSQIISEDNLNKEFNKYLTDIDDFLKSLSIFTRSSNTTSTSSGQYKLYMLESALTNRMNKEKFKKTSYRLALLPHCLRDFRDQCKASQGEVDQECKHCTKDCFINYASLVLKEYNVYPYIWTSRNLKALLKPIIKRYKSVGVIGIACIPELVMGMRRCMKYGLPVIGIPLNANRCVRWMGSYNENSFNVAQLKLLLA
jgi:hypothetical protein